LDEVLADLQVNSQELLEEIEYPGGRKPVPIATTPVRLSRTPAERCRRAPTLGEHTDEVLSEIGFSANEIGALRSAGAM
jgi:crotonobetainyl-CoA:carnitine CoA-transferase CaiB-like acyl-CoA transferase